MKKSIIYLMSLSVGIATLSSCQQDDPPPISTEMDHNTVTIPGKEGIDGNAIDITETDAATVAGIFAKNNYASRTTTKSIKNVVTIKDHDGCPAIYAVNFTDGYVIVSATKKMVPILAEVEHGTFSLDDQPFGRDVIISEYIEEYSALRDKPADEAVRALWLKYDRIPDINAVESRAVSTALSEARYDFIDQLQRQGYTVYTQEQMLEDFPSSIANQFKNTVENKAAHFYEETGQSASYAAVYAVKEGSSSASSYPVQMVTSWGQSAPYNGYSYSAQNPGPNLGCVTIAVAQLMKYYQYPTTFDWAAMPNSLKGMLPTTSPTLVNFLAQLKTELKVNASGGTTNDEAVKVLKSYGYDASESSTRLNIPSYASGTDTNQGVGHAWIVAGYNSINYTTKYVLFFPNEDFLPDYRYIENSSQSYSSYGYSEYMNWGWDGLHDGWYFNGNIRINTTDGASNYSSNRKYINIKGR